MTGGTAYVLDTDDTFESLYNPQLIRVERLGSEEDVNTLKGLIYKHLEMSESSRAKEILADWSGFQPKFWKVVPLPPAATKPLTVTKPAASAVPPAAAEVMAAANP